MHAKLLNEVYHCGLVVTPRVWCVNWSHGGSYLATCGDDKTIKVWKYTEGAGLEQVAVISGDHSRTIRYVQFSPCGKFLASGSFDASVIIYEFRDDSFEEVSHLEGHENEIKCCRFSASGEFLATCSRDKTVWIWQVDEEGEYEVGSILQAHTADVKFLAWHPNEDVLVSGGYDCSLRFYSFDGDDWLTHHTVEEAHGDTIWSGSFGGTTRTFLATCGADKTIKVWKQSGEMPNTWMCASSHTVPDTKWPLYSIAWNPNNEMIAVGGGDSTVRIFTFDEENEALVMQDSLEVGAEVNSVAWNPKAQFQDVLAAACDDGTVKLIKAMTD